MDLMEHNANYIVLFYWYLPVIRWIAVDRYDYLGSCRPQIYEGQLISSLMPPIFFSSTLQEHSNTITKLENHNFDD